MELEKQPLLGNGSAHKPFARQWFSSHHVIAERERARNNRRVIGKGVFSAVLAEAL
jgi:hypothetical protein